jgi:hypothetical protein
LRHSGGDKRLCTSATVTLYFDVELETKPNLGILFEKLNYPKGRNHNSACSFKINFIFIIRESNFWAIRRDWGATETRLFLAVRLNQY